jgi:hypothetical protein
MAFGGDFFTRSMRHDITALYETKRALEREVKGVLMIEYKVVELSVVTDESIEEVLNTRTAEGWHFDGIQFVIREASKRPSMAFVLFTREA